MSKNVNNIYLILVGVFITSLIVSNLIFQKFFQLNIIGFNFSLSVGIIFYPITFLVTDLVSEIFGKKHADQMVISGVFASIFCLLVVLLADYIPASNQSPVSNELFHSVFGNTIIAVGASMTTYLCAQFVDIRIYHFWKNLTKGKHLWLRNNGSTIFSQFIDTFIIFTLLCSGGVIPWEDFQKYFISGFIFKIIIALIDTPIIYICVFILRKKFNLKMGEELK